MIKKIIGLFISFIILSWIILILIYPFMNNSKDVLEELTYEDLVIFYMMQPIEQEDIDRSLQDAERYGLNVNDSLYDVLKDNDLVESVDISVEKQLLNGQADLGKIQYRLTSGESVILNLAILDKAFFRRPPNAMLLTPISISCKISDKHELVEYSNDIKIMRALTLVSFSENSTTQKLVETIHKYCTPLLQENVESETQNQSISSTSEFISETETTSEPILQTDESMVASEITSSSISEINIPETNSRPPKLVGLEKAEESANLCYGKDTQECNDLFDYCSENLTEENCSIYMKKLEKLAEEDYQ